MKRIRVMAIAPYEGLRETVTAVAANYRDQLEVTTILGDLASGAVYARKAERDGYDVIISRGGTAEMILKNVSIPVINIEVSGYDYMRAIRLADSIRGPKAFVGFPYITERARSVNELLQTDIDIFTVREQEEIAPLLKKLTNQGYELIIGDVATCRAAEELDIRQRLLLTSGEESIIDAFESVIAWTSAYSASMERLQLLQQAAVFSDRKVVILSESGELVYAAADLEAMGLTREELRQYIAGAGTGAARNFMVTKECTVLYISMKELISDQGARLWAFYIEEAVTDGVERLQGVKVRNFKVGPADREFLRQNSIYTRETIRVARSFCFSAQPVLLTGDNGVGKMELAVSIHRYSDRWNKPFIQVDCSAVDPLEVMGGLLQNGRRLREGGTICFEAVESVPRQQQRSLLDALERLDNGKLRFMATGRSDLRQMSANGEFDEKLYRFFAQLTLYIPNISESRQNLRKVVSFYVIEANTKLGRQVVSVDDEAIKLIEEHSWPYNFEQLQQAVFQMVLMAEGTSVGRKEAKAVIDAREHGAGTAQMGLEGTLEEIELRVIRAVLEEEKGNLSRTAQRLGVGRSTLWRKLRAESPRAVSKP